MDSPLVCKAAFQPSLDSIRPEYRGTFKATCNPTALSKKQGKYQPRLTYYQRPRSSYRMEYELAIELSLPKLVFGNNYDELQDIEFAVVVKRLQDALKEMGIWLFTHQIEVMDVRAIHFSKNFVFTDYTSCSSILQMLRTADISKTYDVQDTNFRNGGYVFHVHTNSLDIAFYDKLADLRQAKTSDKRAVEKDNHVQLNMLDLLARQKPLSIMRYEVRLNGRKKVIDSLGSVGFSEPLSFKNVYSFELAKNVLEHHWQKFFDNLPKLVLDADEPDKLLANILMSGDVAGPVQAAARLGLAILVQGSEQRLLRTMFEERFGKHAWARIKPLLAPADKVQYKSILNIGKALSQFEPTKIDDIKHVL